MIKLKARKPKVEKVGRIKAILYAKEKVGKSIFTLGFPNVYYIDTEAGAIRPQYQKKLLDAGGDYMGRTEGSLDFRTVIEQVKGLATQEHRYKTLVINSFTKLYNTEKALAELKIGNAFGADKKEANKPSRQLLTWLDKLDMNVILTCHSIEKWVKGENVGTTFDGFDKLAYELDLLLEAKKEGKKRLCFIKGSRIDNLKEGSILDLEYKNFAEIFGTESLEAAHKVFESATPEQVSAVLSIIKEHGIGIEKQNKWLSEMKSDEWQDAAKIEIQKIIDHFKKGE